MNVKFSVIVPVHNGEKYIDELMSHILEQAQDMETSPEVILVENGSGDDSAIICDRYAGDYEFVSALHFGKIGAYNARREGMRAATGDYLVFFDVDDGISDELFSELEGYISFFHDRGKRADVILYNAASYHNRDKRLFDFPFEENKVYQDKSDFYEIMQRNDSLNALWNKALSSTLVKRIIDQEDSGVGPEELLNHGEDLLQTAQILDLAVSIAFLDRILYYYRENSEGLTGTYHSEALENQARAWSAFESFARRWSGDEYKEIIDERKTLTCCISVSKLIYSRLSGVVIKRELTAMLEDPFYKQYALGALPDWAPEEDVFVHALMKGSQPMKKLLSSSRSYRFRQAVKRIIRRK